MKKLFASFLFFFLLIFSFPAVADEELLHFEPSLTNYFDFSASQWISNDKYRALLTVMLSVDYEPENPKFDASSILTGTSYVGYIKDARSLIVCILTESNEVHSLIYYPNVGTAFHSSYSSQEDSSDLIIEAVFREQCDKYYRNSIFDILDVLEQITEDFE